jgi:adenosylcobinamide kinase/adenosylcobinamide-phosphate guanylyltransferase
MKIILVTGGARSGKSSFAEQLAVRLGERGTYIATAQALDAEMAARVAQHRVQRDGAAPGFWATAEEPLRLAELLEALDAELSAAHSAEIPGAELASRPARDPASASSPCATSVSSSTVVLVDCLTLWLSNWVLAHEEDVRLAALIDEKLDELIEAVSRFPVRLVLVTNEVGSGIVPAYKLGRVYRDLAGRMNQRMAQICDQVFLVTAGIPIELKSQAFRLDKFNPGPVT